MASIRNVKDISQDTLDSITSEISDIKTSEIYQDFMNCSKESKGSCDAFIKKISLFFLMIRRIKSLYSKTYDNNASNEGVYNKKYPTLKLIPELIESIRQQIMKDEGFIIVKIWEASQPPSALKRLSASFKRGSQSVFRQNVPSARPSTSLSKTPFEEFKDLFKGTISELKINVNKNHIQGFIDDIQSVEKTKFQSKYIDINNIFGGRKTRRRALNKKRTYTKKRRTLNKKRRAHKRIL